MRWDVKAEITREEIQCDVLFYDAVGVPFIGSTYRETGLGGSEFEVVLVAEALAQKGYKVVVLNNTHYAAIQNGVTYYHKNVLKNLMSFDCKSFVALRSSPLPKNNIKFEKLFIWATDIYNPENYKKQAPLLDSKNPQVSMIYVSEFQKTVYPQHWNSHVVYNMVPDWVYEYKANKNPEQYVYASSAVKGLSKTLEVWTKLKNNYFFKKSKLLVLSPGYDKPQEDLKKFKDVVWCGPQNFEDTVRTIAESRGMFYVNDFSETFGISPLMAEILGTTPQILCLRHPGALPEVLNSKTVVNNTEQFTNNLVKDVKEGSLCQGPKNFRTSFIIDQWERLLVL